MNFELDLTALNLEHLNDTLKFFRGQNFWIWVLKWSVTLPKVDRKYRGSLQLANVGVRRKTWAAKCASYKANVITKGGNLFPKVLLLRHFSDKTAYFWTLIFNQVLFSMNYSVISHYGAIQIWWYTFWAIFNVPTYLYIVGSMGSFEPIDCWKLLNLTYYHLQKK